MIQAYKNLRHFVYLNVKAQYRSEGYRLVQKLLSEATELGRQRGSLDERLEGRKPRAVDWADVGIPTFDERA